MSSQSLKELRYLISCHRPIFSLTQQYTHYCSDDNENENNENKKKLEEDCVNECLTGIVHVISSVKEDSTMQQRNDWKEIANQALEMLLSSNRYYFSVWEMVVSTLSSMWESLCDDARQFMLDWLPPLVGTLEENTNKNGNPNDQKNAFDETLLVLQDVLLRDESVLARILGILSQLCSNTFETKYNYKKEKNSKVLELCLASLSTLSPHDWPTLLQTINTCLHTRNNDEYDEWDNGASITEDAQNQKEEEDIMKKRIVQSIRHEWKIVEKQPNTEESENVHAMVAHVWVQLLSRSTSIANAYIDDYQKDPIRNDWNLLDAVSIIYLHSHDLSLLNPTDNVNHSYFMFLYIHKTFIPQYLEDGGDNPKNDENNCILYDPLLIITPLIHLMFTQFVHVHLVLSPIDDVTKHQHHLIIDAWLRLYSKLRHPFKDQVLTTFLTLTSWNVVELCHSTKTTTPFTANNSQKNLNFNHHTTAKWLDLLGCAITGSKNNFYQKEDNNWSCHFERMALQVMSLLQKIATKYPRDLYSYKHILMDRLWLKRDKVPDDMLHKICAILTEIHNDPLLLLQKFLFTTNRIDASTDMNINPQRVGLIWAQHIWKQTPTLREEVQDLIFKFIFVLPSSHHNNTKNELWHPVIGHGALQFWKSINSSSIFSNIKSLVARTGLIQMDHSYNHDNNETNSNICVVPSMVDRELNNRQSEESLCQLLQLLNVIPAHLSCNVTNSTNINGHKNNPRKRMMFCVSSFLKRSSKTVPKNDIFHSLKEIPATMTFVFDLMDTYLQMGRLRMKKQKLWSPRGWLLAKVDISLYKTCTKTTTPSCSNKNEKNNGIEYKLQLLGAFQIYIALAIPVLKHAYLHHQYLEQEQQRQPKKCPDDSLLIMLRHQIFKIYKVIQEYTDLSKEMTLSHDNPTNQNPITNQFRMDVKHKNNVEDSSHDDKKHQKPVNNIQMKTEIALKTWQSTVAQINSRLLSFLIKEDYIPVKMLWHFLYNKSDICMIESLGSDPSSNGSNCVHTYHEWKKFQDMLVLRCAIIGHIIKILETSLIKSQIFKKEKDKGSFPTFHSICHRLLDRDGIWILFDHTKVLNKFLRLIRKNAPSTTTVNYPFSNYISPVEHDQNSSIQDDVIIQERIVGLVKDLVLASVRLLKLSLWDSQGSFQPSTRGVITKSCSVSLGQNDSSHVTQTNITDNKDQIHVPWLFDNQRDRSNDQLCQDITKQIAACEHINVAWELLDLLITVYQPSNESCNIQVTPIQEASWRLLLTVFVDDPLSTTNYRSFWEYIAPENIGTMCSLPVSFQFLIQHFLKQSRDENCENGRHTSSRDALQLLIKLSLKSTRPYKESYVFTRNIIAHWSIAVLSSLNRYNSTHNNNFDYLIKILESIRAMIISSSTEESFAHIRKDLQNEKSFGCVVRIPGLTESTFSVCFELLLIIICASIALFVPSTHHSSSKGQKTVSPYEQFIKLTVIFKSSLEKFCTNYNNFPKRFFHTVVRSCSLMIQVCEGKLLDCIDWRNSQPFLRSCNQQEDVASVQLLMPLIDELASNCANSILAFCNLMKNLTQNNLSEKSRNHHSNVVVREYEIDEVKGKIAFSYNKKGITALALRSEKFIDFLRTVSSSHNLVFGGKKVSKSNCYDLVPEPTNVDRGYHQQLKNEKPTNVTDGKKIGGSADNVHFKKSIRPEAKKRKRAILQNAPFSKKRNYVGDAFK